MNISQPLFHPNSEGLEGGSLSPQTSMKIGDASRPQDPVAVNLQPAQVFQPFATLMCIPRPTYAEAGVRDWLLEIAQQNGWETRQDATGNLSLRVPGRGAYKSSSIVTLQAHSDMVPTKEDSVIHNFKTDPIRGGLDQKVIRGVLTSVLRAEGTTLGADNGIGLCAALGVALDASLTDCPPLEILCTVQEEIGLRGALALDPSIVAGDILLNLDTEDENEICIGCAGSRDMILRWQVSRATEAPTGMRPLTLKAAGFPGGHSGVTIHEGRSNAIHALTVAATLALEEAQISKAFISQATGGNARNAIARSANIEIWIPKDRSDELRRAFTSDRVQAESLSDLNPNFLDPIVMSVEEGERSQLPFGDLDGVAFLKRVSEIRTGVLAMSQEVPGLVETSNNLGVLASDVDGEITLLCMTRSSKENAVEAFQNSVGQTSGGESITFEGQSPVWQPSPASSLVQTAIAVFTEQFGCAPKMQVIHAGLECGVLKDKKPSIQAISFGPDIKGAHEPIECVSIPSTEKFFRALRALVVRLGEETQA